MDIHFIRRHTPECLSDTPCRTVHGNEGRAIPSLLRATPSATSERLMELLGSSPIHRPLSLVALVFNWGPFPSPALPGFIGTASLSATPNGPACLSRVAS